MSEPRSVQSRIGRAALVVAAGVLLSRILGLLRDIVLAARLGDSAVGDTYEAAFVIPDFLNYLLAGGFLSITFIPIMARHIAADDEDGAWAAFSAVFRPVALLIVVFAGIGIWSAGTLVDAMYGSANDLALTPEQLAEVTRLTRIILPAQVFFVLGALFTAVQYAHQRFVIPTIAPIIYNLGIIVGGLIRPTAAGFITGALVGAFIGNFALQWWGAGRVGLRWVGGQPLFNTHVREYLSLALPLMIGQSVVVLDEQFSRVFAALGDEGDMFALSRARRLNMFPVGLVAQAVGVAAYPFLAKLVAEKRLDEMRDTVVNAVRYVIFAGIGATAVLMAVSQPLVRVVLQRGEFTEAGTLTTAAALVFYSLSIPAWGAHQIYGRGFYAERNMWTPVVVGTVWAIAAIPLFFALFDRLDVAGLALASSLAVAGYATTLGVIWHTRHGGDGVRKLSITGLRSLVGGSIAALAGWFATTALTGGAVPGFVDGIAATAVGALVTMGAYLALTRLLGAPELTELRATRQA